MWQDGLVCERNKCSQKCLIHYTVAASQVVGIGFSAPLDNCFWNPVLFGLAVEVLMAIPSFYTTLFTNKSLKCVTEQVKKSPVYKEGNWGPKWRSDLSKSSLQTFSRAGNTAVFYVLLQCSTTRTCCIHHHIILISKIAFVLPCYWAILNWAERPSPCNIWTIFPLN